MNDVGRPLAMIVGGKYDKKVISVSDKFNKDDEALIKEFKQLKIPNDAKLQQVPDTTKEREIVYMTGPSGSGKSTYTRKYLEQWKKKNKDKEIYMFSSLPEDESLDDVKPQRIKLDRSIYEEPIEVEEFKDSVVIFDDIDVISDQKIRAAVYNILHKVLEIGRHFKITALVTNHLPTNGKDTRRILKKPTKLLISPTAPQAELNIYL
jgi:predicted AAA+ superfamily ATPase